VVNERSQTPAGWLISGLLFGVPAIVFWILFHWLGPALRSSGASWLLVFHLLLIVPLGACWLLLSCFSRSTGVPSGSWVAQLRLSKPKPTAWLWAASLSGFMYGGDLADAIALTAAFAALFRRRPERNGYTRP